MPFICLSVRQVLDACLPYLSDKTIRFADHVLCRVIGEIPFVRLVADARIARCLDLALSTRDESLIESLLIVLRSELHVHAGPFAAARDIQTPHMRRVLGNVG